MATYISPIEAISSRIDEIDIKHGNVIFDIVQQKIFYDTYSTNARIDTSSLRFLDTDEEINTIKGIEEKLYISRKSGNMYHFYNNEFHIISQNNETPRVFYVDENGSDDNDGLLSSTPVKTISSLLSKYPDVNELEIHLFPGTYDILNIENKSYIKIIGDGVLPSIISKINISNSNIFISNIDTEYCQLNNSHGYINTCTFISKNNFIGLYADNSNVLLENIYISDCGIALYIDNNSHVTAVGLSGDNNGINYQVNNGAVLSLAAPNTIQYYNTEYILSNNGRLYPIDAETDVSTKNYIDSVNNRLSESIDEKLRDISISAGIFDMITPEQVDILFDGISGEVGENLSVLSFQSVIYESELDDMIWGTKTPIPDITIDQNIDELKLSLLSNIEDSELDMLFDGEEHEPPYIIDDSVVIDEELVETLALEAINTTGLTDEELESLFE